MPPEAASEGAGLNEYQAAAKIAALSAPPPQPRENGRFVSAKPQAELPPREPSNPDPEPEFEPDAAPDAQPSEGALGDDDIEIDVSDEAEATQPTSLDMPASWGQAAKELWDTLTPEHQKFLREHDSKRTSGLSRQANELKAEQERVKAQAEAIQQQQLQLAQAAQRLRSEAETRFRAKFGDVTDIAKLAAENPARFLEYQAAAMQVQGAMQEAAAWQQAIDQKRIQDLNEFRSEENAKLAERYGLDSEEKATAFQTRIVKFATGLGITEGRLAQYSADEISLLDDAMKYRAAKAKASAATAKPAAQQPPKVIKPGTPTTPLSAAQQSVQQLSQKLKKTGKWEDAAALLKARTARSR